MGLRRREINLHRPSAQEAVLPKLKAQVQQPDAGVPSLFHAGRERMPQVRQAAKPVQVPERVERIRGGAALGGKLRDYGCWGAE